MAEHPKINSEPVPRGNLTGLTRYFSHDVVSGFLVFLIALPLCLGISLASGVPAIAGVFTAIVGAVLTTLISNSELTIKGPAAGLIVIVLGAVTDFREMQQPTETSTPAAAVASTPAAATPGATTPAVATASVAAAPTSDSGHAASPPANQEWSEIDQKAYRMALAVGVVAGVIQIAFGLLKLGILGEFFPTAVVHGMLSAIGVIIISKQIHILLGVNGVKGEPLELLLHVPHSIWHMNPEIALIGIVSLLILFGMPMLKARWIRRIPAQMIVILVAIPLGMYLNLADQHTYSLGEQSWEVGPRYLVDVPGNLLSAMSFPDFGALQHLTAWKWVLMFTLIGSLESLLSVKAIDLIDPWKRKTNLNRDMLAVGIANTVAASIGGLPMISEIVRSKANIDNGARTRFADLWHGLFLLAFVAFLPGLIHQIPLAALAAMLVYTGFRLASPREFVHVYHIGREQLLIFTATMVGVLATDLLLGVLIGIGVKLLIHTLNGVPLRSLFKPYLEVEEVDADTYLVRARESAVFSNWIPFKRTIEDIGFVQRKNLVVDLSNTKLVDHSVMEKLHEVQQDFAMEGLKFELVGLESHAPLAHHEHSARKLSQVAIRRLTAVVPIALENRLELEFVERGATGFTAIPCRGAGRKAIRAGDVPATTDQCRIEVIVPPAVCDDIVAYLRREILPYYPATVCIETVSVLKLEQFTSEPVRTATDSRHSQHDS
ncbi:MAG: SulP family inorganic anion transporter [Pirellulales bacterium]